MAWSPSPQCAWIPSLNGAGSIPVPIQCQAKPPPVAQMESCLELLSPAHQGSSGVSTGLCCQNWWNLGHFPSLSPFPFHFPLPFLFPSFLSPSLPGFVLIPCRRESATATDLFNRLLLLTKVNKIN